MGKLAIYDGNPCDTQFALRNKAMEPRDFGLAARECAKIWVRYANAAEQNVDIAGSDIASLLLRKMTGSAVAYYKNSEVAFASAKNRERHRRNFFVAFGASLLLQNMIDGGAEFEDGIGTLRADLLIDIANESDGLPGDPAVLMTAQGIDEILPEQSGEDGWYHDGSGILVVKYTVSAPVSDRIKRYAASRRVEIPDEMAILNPFVARLA
ncbi:MAG TPA: hypothetical protein VLG47_01810 [Candidatus Saccharimonadales bacterium]|nr:hypothetical protein [Candidatus Saccharimonadales bacterium]